MKLRSRLIVFLSLVVSNFLGAQTDSTYVSKVDSLDTTCRDCIAPVWYFSSHHETVNGIAIGLGDLHKDSCNSTVNGLKVELLGLGVGVGFLNSNTFSEDSALHASLIDNPVRMTKNEVNGFNISLFGTIDDLCVNGVSLGGLAQYIDFVDGAQITGGNSRISGKISGVQLSGVYNNAIICHGIQLSLLGNKAFDLKGIQIGLFNKSEITYGIQFGLWNVNEKRSLPFINWDLEE